MYTVDLYRRVRLAHFVEVMSIRQAAVPARPMLALGLGLAASDLVHKLTRARDERRLLQLQKWLAGLKLLIIDELGFVPLSKTGSELLFEVFSQRYERGSTLVTSNLPFDEWTEVFGSQRLTGILPGKDWSVLRTGYPSWR